MQRSLTNSSHMLGVPSGRITHSNEDSRLNGLIDEWAPNALQPDEKYEETEFKADFTSEEATSPIGSDETQSSIPEHTPASDDFLSIIQDTNQSHWTFPDSQSSQDFKDIPETSFSAPIEFKEEELLEEGVYLQGDLFETERLNEVDEEIEDPDAALARKYNQPSSVTCSRITVGFWTADSVELKFLFGRRKIKYEMRNNSKEVNMVVEFDFSQISGLEVDTKKKTMTIELSKPPHFSARENGKWVKVSDFTQGNVTLYRRHKIEVESGSFRSHIARFFDCEAGIAQLAEIPLSNSGQEPTFLAECVCDWDRENVATIHCDACDSNYCDECDEILHRHPDKKPHKRTPYGESLKKKTKRKKKDRCRCGTGATKGTLGEPCTGNRCPCFGEGRKCSSCGCKNCHNPANAHPDAEESVAVKAGSKKGEAKQKAQTKISIGKPITANKEEL
eukprot:TRINITY_DN3797_c0_g1_i1.p1 TRINITY_DN3797_c0_g1~~TRINITY_DN3797_c0_g1_i1.p1  ORF type:complete len:448 (-),score=76.47 TRINITY_DN3797_c0_g1_i1:233-1576(-)